MLALIIAASGCSRGIDTQQAVRQAVIDYLSNRKFNVAAMNVNVNSVSFRKDEADAVVSFTAKGGDPAKGLSMRYTLSRQGSHWVVKEKAEAAGNPHGGAMMEQPGEAGGNPHSGAITEQPGEAGGAANPLPPGHPPLNSKQ
jgi:hypothetical protein